MPALRRFVLPLVAVAGFAFVPAAGAQSGILTLPTALRDIIVGTAGPDVVNALDGNDSLKGGAGNDKLDGASGNDRIDGGTGNDVIEGRSGNDVLIGGKGKDQIDGGSGRDTIRARDGQADEIFCGGGKDVATVDAKDKVSATCEKVKAPKGVKVRKI